MPRKIICPICGSDEIQTIGVGHTRRGEDVVMTLVWLVCDGCVTSVFVCTSQEIGNGAQEEEGEEWRRSL